MVTISAASLLSDDPERTLARGFVEHAKTVVTGLDATVRQAGTSRLILDIDDPDPLPRLDVKTGARGQLEVVKLLGGGVPMGRAGSAEEVAKVMLWLLGDGASYVSGTLVDVSGGR